MRLPSALSVLPTVHTSILVSQIMRSDYVGAIAVAAYSYMALVPIIQPFAIRLVTTKKRTSDSYDIQPEGGFKVNEDCFP